MGNSQEDQKLHFFCHVIQVMYAQVSSLLSVCIVTGIVFIFIDDIVIALLLSTLDYPTIQVRFCAVWNNKSLNLFIHTTMENSCCVIKENNSMAIHDTIRYFIAIETIRVVHKNILHFLAAVNVPVSANLNESLIKFCNNVNLMGSMNRRVTQRIINVSMWPNKYAHYLEKLHSRIWQSTLRFSSLVCFVTT